MPRKQLSGKSPFPCQETGSISLTPIALFLMPCSMAFNFEMRIMSFLTAVPLLKASLRSDKDTLWSAITAAPAACSYSK